MTDTDYRRRTRPLSQVEVEDRIQSVMDRMESETEAFDDIAKAAAEAEAEYRRQCAMATLAVIEHGEKKMTVSEREARVHSMTSDAHKTYLITQAARNSAREHLLSLRDLMHGLQTLNASIRAQT